MELSVQRVAKTREEESAGACSIIQLTNHLWLDIQVVSS